MLSGELTVYIYYRFLIDRAEVQNKALRRTRLYIDCAPIPERLPRQKCAINT